MNGGAGRTQSLSTPGDPMNNFNKLTERAQAAVMGAQHIAQERNAAEIDPLHLLASLLEDAESVPAVVLRQMRVDVANLITSVTAALDAREKVFGASEPGVG